MVTEKIELPPPSSPDKSRDKSKPVTAPVLRAFVEEGDWEAETPPKWQGKRALTSAGFIAWKGLTWAPLQLRRNTYESSQLVFQIWANEALVGEGLLDFIQIENEYKNAASSAVTAKKNVQEISTGYIPVKIVFPMLLDELFGGKEVSVIAVLLVSSVPVKWVPPPRSKMSWAVEESESNRKRRRRRMKKMNEKRSIVQENSYKLITRDRRTNKDWTIFPLTPINVGIVRQKFGFVAKEYDGQEVIHPCFFGFAVRYESCPLRLLWI